MKKYGQSSIRLLFSNVGSLIFLSTNVFLFLLFFSASINAQTSMSNDSFIIRFPNLNSFAGKPSNAEYSLGITGGQIAPGLYSGSNYKVRAGFQYIHSIIPFSFSISSVFVDFGPITPGAPLTRTSTLTISNGSAYGYSILASENHPLRALATGVSIPDTTCDSGTCDEANSAEWTSLTTYGFGYRCDNVTGTDCNTDFSTPDYYKQFSSSESAELAEPVMTGLNVGRNISGQITYKVNISSTQPAGIYQNAITYIATPSI
jgi:hypothetical protein